LRAFDFDGTIFAGDSTVRFCLFCIKRHPFLIKHLMKGVFALIGYRRGRIDKTQAKEKLFSFLAYLPDPEGEVAEFWRTNIRHLRKWYLKMCLPSGVIVSASPEFLLRIPCEALGVHTLIASRVDVKTGAYTGKNCDGGEKVARFREVFGKIRPEEFYSDSLSDAPMAEYALRAYRVRGEKISPWG
jgi:phosphatidylglycerophosphatase C